MTGNFNNCHRLGQFIVRLPKESAAFTYFTLESNEGLAFYSTLKGPATLGREILIHCTPEFIDHVQALLIGLKKRITIHSIDFSIINDSDDYP